MGKAKIIFIIGILNILVPFLGLPNVWKTGFFVATGLGLIFIAYSIRAPKKKMGEEIEAGSFNESHPE